MKKQKTKNKKAFTVIETFVTIGIFTLIMLGVTYMVFSGFRYYHFILNQAELVSDLQKSSSAITKEIREMRQSDSGSYALSEASENEIVFYSNLDDSSDVEMIRYFKSGECLKKGVIKPTGSPARYLDTNEVIVDVTCNAVNGDDEPFFTFYSGYPSDETVLENPIELQNVKVIKFYLRVESTGQRPVPTSKTISLFITPRNINLPE